jgi:hypothetical protein
MEENYKLHRIRELADNDEEFILALAKTFLEEVPTDALLLKEAVENENRPQTYQVSHKMKPVLDIFELGVLDKIEAIQNWTKLENTDVEPSVSIQLADVLEAVEKASAEIKADFNI